MSPIEEILAAAENGDVAKITAMLGADPSLANAKGGYDKTPLHVACEKNHVAAVRALIGAGADVEAQTAWGMTPLEWASNCAGNNGHTEVARFLLERGADIHFKGFFGATALHWAAANGHTETVDFLLANGARCDLQDGQRQSTLRGWALEFGHTEIAAKLA